MLAKSIAGSKEERCTLFGRWCISSSIACSVCAYTGNMIERKPVIEVMDDDMAEILKKKTPAERLGIAFALWTSARDMLTTMLASQHPNWSKERVATEAARRLSHGAC